MKISCIWVSAVFLLLASTSALLADTFKHRQTNEVLHGYATSNTENGKTTVHTQEKGQFGLNLGDYNITPDPQGRNNKVIVITIDDEIMLELATAALEQAIANAADKGPLFILLEMDTPGGRDYLAQRISAAITKADTCQVICFIKGGKYRGSISAGVTVTLSCNKIYMANNTALGGAASWVPSKEGPKDLKKAYGEVLGEKFTSILRANLASLAERNGRPTLLARAMVDKDIEVIEVSDVKGRRFFINPADKKPQQNLVKTWNTKNSLLTLTADEACKCRMADKVVNSRQELLADLNADKAEIVTDDCFRQAQQEFKRAELRFSQLRKSLDLKIKYLKNEQTLPKALRYLREIRTDFKSLISLAKKYPDLNLNVEELQRELNSVEAAYEHARTAK